MREGRFALTADVTTPQDGVGVAANTQVFQVQHVERGTRGPPVPCVPVVQPHPFVEISKPAEAKVLPPDASWQVVSSANLDELLVRMGFQGTLSDFFGDIISMTATVEPGASTALCKGADFGDTGFNSRPLELKDLGEFTVRLEALNALGRRTEAGRRGTPHSCPLRPPAALGSRRR
jgi:hypothetical protein